MSDELKHLADDADGMEVYDFLVNHTNESDELLDHIIDRLYEADTSGQFMASSARFLHALDPVSHHSRIGRLIEGAIDKDRERRYIGSLLEAIWGVDYKNKAADLGLIDDNFRRIYKRIFPNEESL